MYYINSVIKRCLMTNSKKHFKDYLALFFPMGDFFEIPDGSQVQTIGPYYYGYQMTVGPDGKTHHKYPFDGSECSKPLFHTCIFK